VALSVALFIIIQKQGVGDSLQKGPACVLPPSNGATLQANGVVIAPQTIAANFGIAFGSVRALLVLVWLARLDGAKWHLACALSFDVAAPF